jgi:hypothetical protein
MQSNDLEALNGADVVADAEASRLELREALETLRSQAALLIQAFGVIITADSLLLAYGFAQRKSAILLVASLMPVTVFVIYFSIIAGYIPVAYVALRIEQRLHLEDALMDTWLRQRYDLPFHKLAHFADLSEPEVRDDLLGTPWYLLKGDPKGVFLFGAFLVQFAIFWVSLAVYHYPFM